MYELAICTDYVIDFVAKFYHMPKDEVNDFYLTTKSIDETLKACDICSRLGHKSLGYARSYLKTHGTGNV